MDDTEGRKVLVVGASGGVGKCLVRRLLERGYEVLGSAMDQDDLENAKKDGLADAKLFIANFCDAEIGGTQISEVLADTGGSIAAVIGCAGINPCGPLETTPISVFRRTMEINAVANLAIYQAALPYLRKSRGRFIFVSSLAGKVAMPLLGYYSASKYALEGLADTMRLEAGQWGVPVSLVQPGAIATGMVHGFGAQLEARLAELDEQSQENYRDFFLQQKAFANTADTIAITPDAVARTIVEVVEAEVPESRYPTGNAIDFLEKRRSLSDRDMDEMLNQLLPGQRMPD